MANISNVSVKQGNVLSLSGSSVQITGSISASGDLYLSGILTAREYHTQIVTSSVIYESGSTKFGDDADDTHQFTGSVNITGAVNVIGQVSASSFVGDGSQLRNLSLSGSAVTSLNLGANSNLSSSGTTGVVTIALSQSLDIANVTASNTVSASVGKFTTLSASNAQFSGSVLIYGTASLASNPDAAYVRYTGLPEDKILMFPGLKVSGSTVVSGNLDVTGAVSASSFTGSGAALTNLPASSLTGQVSLTNGGTGKSITGDINGKLLIGSGSALEVGELVAGNFVGITKQSGSIKIDVTGSVTGSRVTSLSLGVNSNLSSSGTTGEVTIALTSSVTGLSNLSSSAITGSNILASNSLNAAGMFYVAQRTTTSTSYNIDESGPDHVVFVSGAVEDVVITLPDATAHPGRQLIIKKSDSNTSISIAISGPGTGDGDSYQLYGPYQSVILVSDGVTGWYVT